MEFIDLTYLNNISSGDREFIRHMLNMFLDETVSDVLEIEKYVKNNACGQVATLAHKVKGPLQMLNARSVTLIEQIEAKSRKNGPIEEIAVHYGELKKLVSEDMRDEVKQLLTEY